MASIPCFTFKFTQGGPKIESGIILDQGILTLGEGHGRKRFDALFRSSVMVNVKLRSLKKICSENICEQKLPKDISNQGALVLCRTGRPGSESGLQGYSRRFKGNPNEIVSGRGVRYTGRVEPSVYTDSLWFLMPHDRIFVVEQDHTSHTGIIVIWEEGMLTKEKVPHDYFAGDSE